MQFKKGSTYEEKAKYIIDLIKGNMSYYRVVKTSNDMALLEQVHTKNQVTTNIPELIKTILNSSTTAGINTVLLSNPSLLKKSFNTEDKYNSFLFRNNSRIYKLEKKGEPDELGLYRFEGTALTGGCKDVQISDIIESVEKSQYFIITNPEILADELVKYFEIFDKKNCFKYIAKLLIETFSHEEGYTIDTNVNMEKENKIRFSLGENGSQQSRIFLSFDGNNLCIKAKRNNNILDTKVSLRNIRNIGQQKYELIAYKLHFDICNFLKITPFRYMTTKRYWSDKLRNTYSYYHPQDIILTLEDFKKPESEFGSCEFKLCGYSRQNPKEPLYISEKPIRIDLQINKQYFNAPLSKFVGIVLSSVDNKVFILKESKNLKEYTDLKTEINKITNAFYKKMNVTASEKAMYACGYRKSRKQNTWVHTINEKDKVYSIVTFLSEKDFRITIISGPEKTIETDDNNKPINFVANLDANMKLWGENYTEIDQMIKHSYITVLPENYRHYRYD